MFRRPKVAIAMIFETFSVSNGERMNQYVEVLWCNGFGLWIPRHHQENLKQTTRSKMA
jgi:hypothetical protein